MSDELPLPPRPQIDFYRKLAKELRDVTEPAQLDALAARWLSRFDRADEYRRKLQRAWTELRARVPEPQLSDAQFFVARVHGFASWPKFADHVQHLANASTQDARFEAAADAIVTGDVATLRRLLAEDPALVRARSPREHRSTLLHYVAANGFEDWRQRTPRNAVEVARLLLDAGAEVDAESDAYGGRSTTLGLAATSAHPRLAGVQLDLMALLVARGARIDAPDGGSMVDACLANGCPEAAAWLAERGAKLTLAGAAGVGRLDVVRARLAEGARDPEALHWAAYAGHADVVAELLARGADVHARDPVHGATPLGFALYAWRTRVGAPGSYHAVVAALARAGAERDPDAPPVEDARMAAALEGRLTP
jgi:ankyrin repeat protein